VKHQSYRLISGCLGFESFGASSLPLLLPFSTFDPGLGCGPFVVFLCSFFPHPILRKGSGSTNQLVRETRLWFLQNHSTGTSRDLRDHIALNMSNCRDRRSQFENETFAGRSFVRNLNSILGLTKTPTVRTKSLLHTKCSMTSNDIRIVY